MKIGIIQLNGCTKCLNSTQILGVSKYALKQNEMGWYDLSSIPDKLDLAIIVGYANADDKDKLDSIRKNATKVIALGSCATLGGIFGLANQKGHNITPVHKLISIDSEIHGCLPSLDELATTIKSGDFAKKKLCRECTRKASCDFLDSVNRQVDLSEIDAEACFNDAGYLCSGFIANNCQEKCIDFGAPCRGCNPSVGNSSIRMLSMFGTLMGQMEVATEASSKGATDKLADGPDDITAAFPDVVGSYFRFSLAESSIPRGKIPSTGSLEADIFVGRPIEELPMITAMMGGDSFIDLTLDVINAVEGKLGIALSDEHKNLHDSLRTAQKAYIEAANEKDGVKLEAACDSIRGLAGNMNLSNITYGGPRADAHPIEFSALSLDTDKYHIETDDNGIITKWEAK